MQPHRFGVFDQDGQSRRKTLERLSITSGCRGARNVASLPHDIVCRTLSDIIGVCRGRITRSVERLLSSVEKPLQKVRIGSAHDDAHADLNARS
ncbi:hypothetical protein [Mesorhizobium escarrei]|uniref:hypothetical protein n=1 Tax=Mesorhizobium escarrei TaxID=666018 RepID=UPI0020A701C7|nr:hypothetical protein [Mesorhizobium escarrei]